MDLSIKPFTTDEKKNHNDDKKVFIGGLPPECAESDITDYFSKYGEIFSVDLKMDPTTGKTRGFAFITFSSQEAVTKIENDTTEHIILNKKVDTKRAIPRSSKYQNRKIFIGGIAHYVPQEDIAAYFSQYGNVTEVTMPMDEEKKIRKGFSFVTFETEEMALRACATTKQHIGGRLVDVKLAIPEAEKLRMRRNGGTGGPLVGGHNGQQAQQNGGYAFGGRMTPQQHGNIVYPPNPYNGGVGSQPYANGGGGFVQQNGHQQYQPQMNGNGQYHQPQQQQQLQQQPAQQPYNGVNQESQQQLQKANGGVSVEEQWAAYQKQYVEWARQNPTHAVQQYEQQKITNGNGSQTPQIAPQQQISTPVSTVANGVHSTSTSALQLQQGQQLIQIEQQQQREQQQQQRQNGQQSSIAPAVTTVSQLQLAGQNPAQLTTTIASQPLSLPSQMPVVTGAGGLIMATANKLLPAVSTVTSLPQVNPALLMPQHVVTSGALQLPTSSATFSLLQAQQQQLHAAQKLQLIGGHQLPTLAQQPGVQLPLLAQNAQLANGLSVAGGNPLAALMSNAATGAPLQQPAATQLLAAPRLQAGQMMMPQLLPSGGHLAQLGGGGGPEQVLAAQQALFGASQLGSVAAALNARFKPY